MKGFFYAGCYFNWIMATVEYTYYGNMKTVF